MSANAGSLKTLKIQERCFRKKRGLSRLRFFEVKEGAQGHRVCGSKEEFFKEEFVNFEEAEKPLLPAEFSSEEVGKCRG